MCTEVWQIDGDCYIEGCVRKDGPPTLVRYCNDAIRTKEITEQCRTIDGAVLPIAPSLPGPDCAMFLQQIAGGRRNSNPDLSYCDSLMK
ncbi:hypothetical protein Zmor_017965 [Zophobas morio]|uniref:Uncharacterized protein n=1 Tax=Zophobas morio TaxID=2755281 RepID=A0AA38IAN6_9CUCU|nr:hypothetical protein Zmor_017965 [Zophobas morio]